MEHLFGYTLATAVCILLLLCTVWTSAADDAPQHPIKFQVLEELPPNRLIANVANDAGLDRKYSSDVLKKLRFSFLTQPNLDGSYIAINEVTGVIKTTERIDRDVICPHQLTCFLNYDVALQPIEYFQIIKIQIEIIDVNDHAPMFPQSHITHKLSESTIPGTSFGIPTAYDPDSGSFGIEKYDYEPKGGIFELQVRQSADGTPDLRIIVKDRLDRETEHHYFIKVTAADGGQPPQSGSILIDIFVVDSNDNDPVFENSTYKVFVLENTPPGTPILQVKAHDPDDGLNGEIEYKLSTHTATEFKGIFSIDIKTGKIFVEGELDYEKTPIYLLSVTAQDKGPDSLPVYATVEVHVEDRNDNAPEITVNILTSSGDAEVMENSKPGTFVAHVSVNDLDSGENGRVTCTLYNRNFILKEMYKTEYKIITDVTLDRETKQRYKFNIQCEDHGVQPQASMTKITVNIIDANDHIPRFTEDPYEVSLEENNRPGQFVVQVAAMDRDSGSNSEIVFSLQKTTPFSDLFTIDSRTGAITCNTRLNHELTHQITLFVTASDRGDPPASSNSTIIINVLDQDDETPRFKRNHYNFGTFENQAPGTEIGTVTAIDLDSSLHNKFHYAIDKEYITDMFSVNPYTGSITINRILDREEQDTYEFVVVAQSLTNPRINDKARVTVRVADKNDNYPIFQYPVVTNNSVYFTRTMSIGHVLCVVRSTDRDSGKNSKVSYFITKGNDEKFFSIDMVTGAVTIEEDLSKTTKTHFHLVLKAEDHGDSKRTTTTDLHILLTGTVIKSAQQTQHFLLENHLFLIVGMAAAAVLLATIIAIALVIIRRRDNKHHQTAASAREMQSMLSRNVSPNHQAPGNHYVVDRDLPVLGSDYQNFDDLHTDSDSEDQLGIDDGYPPPPPGWLMPSPPPSSPGRRGHLSPGTSHEMRSFANPGPVRWQAQVGHSHSGNAEQCGAPVRPRAAELDAISVASTLSDSGRGHSSEEGDLNHMVNLRQGAAGGRRGRLSPNRPTVGTLPEHVPQEAAPHRHRGLVVPSPANKTSSSSSSRDNSPLPSPPPPPPPDPDKLDTSGELWQPRDQSSPQQRKKESSATSNSDGSPEAKTVVVCKSPSARAKLLLPGANKDSWTHERHRNASDTVV